MDRPPKGNLRLLVIISLVVGTLVVTGFFLFVFFAKTEWRDAPVYSEAKNVQTQFTNNGSVRTTTFTVNKRWKYFAFFYMNELRDQHWYQDTFSPEHIHLKFIDSTKNNELS